MMELIRSNAEFNKDRTHRYALQRKWGKGERHILFIGLNPSRADETFNDPTITRCINFAKDWGSLSIWTFKQCKKCGCSNLDPCISKAFGPCWWMNEGEDLCSHCIEGVTDSHRNYKTFDYSLSK